MTTSDVKDVSVAVMRRIRLHNLTTRFMGLGVFLFITGMGMSHGGNRGGPGVIISTLGGWILLFGLAYGLGSTIIGIRCPNCRTRLGAIVSSLYAPIGVPDDYAPNCPGCGAVLLPLGERARAMRSLRNMIVGMVALLITAGVLAWLLGRV